MPGLVFVGTFLVIGFSLALMPSSQTKRPYKVMFLVASIASAGFTIGLYSGLFESATLLADSHIDVSRSLAILHLQNNGLTGLTVNKFELGNMSFTFKDRVFGLNKWAPGETKYYVIYFAERSLDVTHGNQTYFSPMMGSHILSVDGELTPSTFQRGVSYPLTLTTNRLLRHKFDVEAKHTLDEELGVKVYASRFEHRVEVSIRFNNTGSYYSYIYSIEIASVTFLFEPPAMASPYSWYDALWVNFCEEPGISWSSSMIVGNMSATPTPQLSMLLAGETYEVLVRTMAGRLYTTNVTI